MKHNKIQDVSLVFMGRMEEKKWYLSKNEILNLPPISSSALKIAAKTSASKLLEEVKVTCRVFLLNNGDFAGYLKDLALLNSSESLLSGGTFGTSAKLTGLSESVIIVWCKSYVLDMF